MSGIIGQLLIGSGVIGELQGRGFNSRTNMLAAVARKKASGFVYSSTGFNGSTFMDATDPIPDGKTGLFSVWMKLDSGTSDAADYYLTANAAYGFYFGRTAAGVFSLTLAGVGTIVSNVSVLKGAWHHIASSWDAATNTKYLYIDGVDRLTAVSLTNANIDYASGAHRVGAVMDGTLGFNGLLSEFFFTDQLLDLSNPANLLKLRTAGGKPANLGLTGSTPTGTTPRIYLHNPYSTFQTNVGTGGNFTVTGALTDGGADKP